MRQESEAGETKRENQKRSLHICTHETKIVPPFSVETRRLAQRRAEDRVAFIQTPRHMANAYDVLTVQVRSKTKISSLAVSQGAVG